MNEGYLALGLVAATIALGIFLATNRHVIWPARPARPARPSRPRVETELKQAETVSAPVSAITMPDNDAEMVAARVLAKLIADGQVKETAALQTVFAVRAGSSRRYKEVQSKLKIAQSELEKEAELVT